jgi:hypothetical protein
MTTKPLIVVHDAEGRIVHIHDWSLFEGPDLPPEAQMEKQAIDMAAQSTGRQKSEFATLHARPEDMCERVEYKVDVKKKSLIGARVRAKKEK